MLHFDDFVFVFIACNVGDEGGFAPNIQNNEEGWLPLLNGLMISNSGALCLMESYVISFWYYVTPCYKPCIYLSVPSVSLHCALL